MKKYFLDFFFDQNRSKIYDYFWSKKNRKMIFSKIGLITKFGSYPSSEEQNTEAENIRNQKCSKDFSYPNLIRFYSADWRFLKSEVFHPRDFRGGFFVEVGIFVRMMVYPTKKPSVNYI